MEGKPGANSETDRYRPLKGNPIRRGPTSFLAARLLLTAIICTLLTAGGPATASSHEEDSPIGRILEKSLGPELSERDPDRQFPKGVGLANEGNCSVNTALTAMFFQDDSYTELLAQAAKKYEVAAELLEDLAKQPGFKRELSDFQRREFYETGLFPNWPETEADILKQIAALAREAQEAAQRIADGKGGKTDLRLVVRNAADISRLIADYFEVLVA